MTRFEKMDDDVANALATQRVYGLYNWVYDPDENSWIYGDGTYFPIVNYVSKDGEAFRLAKENKISMCFDDEMPFAYHGIWYDDIYGAVDKYDHESHNDNINRAIVNVFLSMTDKR